MQNRRPSLTVRSRPFPDADTVCSLAPGQWITATAAADEWLQVQPASLGYAEGTALWVERMFVDPADNDISKPASSVAVLKSQHLKLRRV